MTRSEMRSLRYLRAVLTQRLSLKEDKADDEVIDQALRAGVEMRGTNLWVLMFAIFVASIGLNVNSTAVIIGAMLISPLMGPIMGIGYGVGIADFALMRHALKNLGIAVLIALLTSTVYFICSPLTAVQSELLARTTPTFWDVLIALFGGFAGIIGATRKEKSNIIPGVAIATALMPPICTAGYSLANGQWSFFLGAFYLFTINSVFIAFSSAVIIRAFHIREKVIIDPHIARRVHAYVITVILLTGLPSSYLAYLLVQEVVFKSRATQFVDEKLNLKRTHVAETIIDPKDKRIEVTLIGEILPKRQLGEIAEHLSVAGLAGAKLEIHQAEQGKIDFSSLRTGLLSDLYAQSQLSLEKKDKTIWQLQEELKTQNENRQHLLSIPQELHAIFPQITQTWLSEAINWDKKTGVLAQPVLVVTDLF